MNASIRISGCEGWPALCWELLSHGKWKTGVDLSRTPPTGRHNPRLPQLGKGRPPFRGRRSNQPYATVLVQYVPRPSSDCSKLHISADCLEAEGAPADVVTRSRRLSGLAER